MVLWSNYPYWRLAADTRKIVDTINPDKKDGLMVRVEVRLRPETTINDLGMFLFSYHQLFMVFYILLLIEKLI